MSRFISDRGAARALLCVLGAVTVLLTACDLGTVTVPNTTSSVVVHAVLNPNFPSQVILVERTLTGTITIPDSGFDPNNPVVSGGGVPVSGATVEIIDSTGARVEAVEDASLAGSKGKGAGVYRTQGPSLVLGARYELHVRTLAGEDLTAFTRVPNAPIRSTGALSRTFNRDHDTLFVRWNAARGATSYYIRIESPFGPFYLLTDSTRFGTDGDLRNIFSNSLQHVFVPGFHQDITVTAVDSNFYNYYRTNNDPFTGAGIISSVTGGLGFFGSVLELTTGTISTIADQTEPIEGRFRLLTDNSATTDNFVSQLTLYVESPPTRSDLPSELSGRYVTPNPNSRSDGVLGQQIGTAVTLALLANQLEGDTLEVFKAQLHGDTLIGNYARSGGSAVFVRAP